MVSVEEFNQGHQTKTSKRKEKEKSKHSGSVESGESCSFSPRARNPDVWILTHYSVNRSTKYHGDCGQRGIIDPSHCMKKKQKKGKRRKRRDTIKSGENLPSRVLAPNISVISGQVLCNIYHRRATYCSNYE